MRTISPGPPARVSLRDGTTISGAPRVDAVRCPWANRRCRCGWTERRWRRSGRRATPSVTCTLVVRQGDKEIFRRSESLGTPEIVKFVEVARLRGHTAAVGPWSSPRMGGRSCRAPLTGR